MDIKEGEYTPKRAYPRSRLSARCVLKVDSRGDGGPEALFVEASDYSEEGGLRIIFDGERLSVGTRVSVYIETLNITKKDAEVVWRKQLNGDHAAGLRWVC